MTIIPFTNYQINIIFKLKANNKHKTMQSNAYDNLIHVITILIMLLHKKGVLHLRNVLRFKQKLPGFISVIETAYFKLYS